MDGDLHVLLAQLPYEHDVLRWRALSGWHRYCIEHARDCVLNFREVPLTIVVGLEEAVHAMHHAKEGR